jgi:hypothetical protein
VGNRSFSYYCPRKDVSFWCGSQFWQFSDSGNNFNCIMSQGKLFLLSFRRKLNRVLTHRKPSVCFSVVTVLFCFVECLMYTTIKDGLLHLYPHNTVSVHCWKNGKGRTMHNCLISMISKLDRRRDDLLPSMTDGIGPARSALCLKASSSFCLSDGS